MENKSSTKIFTLFCLCLVYLASFCPAEERKSTNFITASFIEERGGYYGLEGITLAKHRPDYANNRHDLEIGQLDNGKGTERQVRSLLRFTDLNIPKDSEIISATLTLRARTVNNIPSIAIYGLLKEFQIAPKSNGAAAQPGESTWNSIHHSQQPWGQPGAAKSSSEFEYDKDGDHFAKADSIVKIEGPGKYNFDVTRTFLNQYTGGKKYGWILVETTEMEDTFVEFEKEGSKLDISYRPPSGAVKPACKYKPQSKLISFCLAEPDAIIKNMQRVNELPFDGAVFFGVDDANNGNGKGWICNSVFGPDRIDANSYSNFIKTGRIISSSPSPLTDNFLRVNLTVPGTLEPIKGGYVWDNRPRGDDKVTMWWASGFDAVVQNMRVAAFVAKQSGMKGLLFDMEQYGGDIWSFSKLKDAQQLGKTLEETKLQVRNRAEQLMKGINEFYPDATIIVLFYLYTDQPSMVLWNSFVDGMIAGADERIRFVIGNEEAYGFTTKDDFQKRYNWDYLESLKFSAASKKYLKQMEVGFGVYFDRSGWGKNPEIFESAASWQFRLENALETADSYVWVFTGGHNPPTPNWWTGRDLPNVFMEATTRAIKIAGSRRM